MPQIGGKPKVSKATKTPKKTSSSTKRNFTVVIGSKEHGLYVSSSPSSAARKAVSKLCASDKKRKVSFHIREITQKSEKKTYGPYLGYIEKLAKPIELKGRVIRYKPVAKLSGKSSKKRVVKKGGGGTVSKIDSSASSASSALNNDSKKKYPRDLHDVKTKDELLSLIAWVNFVEKERKEFMHHGKNNNNQNNNNHNNNNNHTKYHKASWNNKNHLGYTYEQRDIRERSAIRSLNDKFKNIPDSTSDEKMNITYLINFIIYGAICGPYNDENYFKDIKKYAVKMKTENPKWKPTESNSNEDDTNWHIINNE